AGRSVKQYAEEAVRAYLTHLGEIPDGLTRADVDAVAAWRRFNGVPVDAGDATDPLNDLIDLHVAPLRDALALRRQLIEEYGIAADRIRLAADPTRSRYGGSQWK